MGVRYRARVSVTVRLRDRSSMCGCPYVTDGHGRTSIFITCQSKASNAVAGVVDMTTGSDAAAFANQIGMRSRLHEWRPLTPARSGSRIGFAQAGTASSACGSGSGSRRH